MRTYWVWGAHSMWWRRRAANQSGCLRTCAQIEFCSVCSVRTSDLVSIRFQIHNNAKMFFSRYSQLKYKTPHDHRDAIQTRTFRNEGTYCYVNYPTVPPWGQWGNNNKTLLNLLNFHNKAKFRLIKFHRFLATFFFNIWEYKPEKKQNSSPHSDSTLDKRTHQKTWLPFVMRADECLVEWNQWIQRAGG